MTERQTYMVWAKNREQAIAIGQRLAEANGYSVVRAEAKKYLEGFDYQVNWKVTLELRPA